MKMEVLNLKVTVICQKCSKPYTGANIKPDVILVECEKCNENKEYVVKEDEMYWNW